MASCSTKRKETVQVIGDLISSWQLPFVINSIVDNGDGTYTLYVPKTYYLQKGNRRKLTINLIDYLVNDVQNNESVTLKGSVIPPANTFNLPVPYYFNGTIIQTNTELKREQELSKKTPMVFLRRPFEETLDAADINDTDTANSAALTLYFLTESNFKEWLTSDHDKNAIVPMRNMIYEFIEMLKANEKYIDRLTNYQVTDLIKFGLVTQNGVTAGLFSDNYSGAELNITLGIKYQCICE
jgi:hypothetical protein